MKHLMPPVSNMKSRFNPLTLQGIIEIPPSLFILITVCENKLPFTMKIKNRNTTNINFFIFKYTEILDGIINNCPIFCPDRKPDTPLLHNSFVENNLNASSNNYPNLSP